MAPDHGTAPSSPSPRSLRGEGRGEGLFPQLRLGEAPPCMLISPTHLVKPFGDSLQSDWAPGTTAVVPGASGWDRVPPWERAPRVSVVHPLLGSCPEQMMGSK